MFSTIGWEGEDGGRVVQERWENCLDRMGRTWEFLPAEHAAYFPKSRHCSSLGQIIHPRLCLHCDWLGKPKCVSPFQCPRSALPNFPLCFKINTIMAGQI